jgi:co-chaperonin GroES (HSP10)
MKLKPLDDRIVVKPNEAEEKTASGLVIPDQKPRRPVPSLGRRSEQTVATSSLDVKKSA